MAAAGWPAKRGELFKTKQDSARRSLRKGKKDRSEKGFQIYPRYIHKTPIGGGPARARAARAQERAARAGPPPGISYVFWIYLYISSIAQNGFS